MGAEKPHPVHRPGTMYQKERRYLPSDLRPAFGSTCGETRSRWGPRNPGQRSNWGFRHPQGSLSSHRRPCWHDPTSQEGTATQMSGWSALSWQWSCCLRTHPAHGVFDSDCGQQPYSRCARPQRSYSLWLAPPYSSALRLVITRLTSKMARCPPRRTKRWDAFRNEPIFAEPDDGACPA